MDEGNMEYTQYNFIQPQRTIKVYAICQKIDVTENHYAIQVIMLSGHRKINLVSSYLWITQTHPHKHIDMQ